jgi:hypothetical protein
MTRFALLALSSLALGFSPALASEPQRIAKPEEATSKADVPNKPSEAARPMTDTDPNAVDVEPLR